MQFLGGKGAYFEKLSYGSETLDMTSEGFGEVFKGDSADTYTGHATGQACADGEQGPPSARAEFFNSIQFSIGDPDYVFFRNVLVSNFEESGSQPLHYASYYVDI